ncbi:hypothetical protein [Anaerobacterium chartisolvens]|uniref:hypothetical protein n=1 Tax=Anaerobacterium chartisolvens TaxID=1297424 RepID=UPI000DF2E380|nr:hypothetical protein [Anaerobacterium chartisolvens]
MNKKCCTRNVSSEWVCINHDMCHKSVFKHRNSCSGGGAGETGIPDGVVTGYGDFQIEQTSKCLFCLLAVW